MHGHCCASAAHIAANSACVGRSPKSPLFAAVAAPHRKPWRNPAKPFVSRDRWALPARPAGFVTSLGCSGLLQQQRHRHAQRTLLSGPHHHQRGHLPGSANSASHLLQGRCGWTQRAGLGRRRPHRSHRKDQRLLAHLALPISSRQRWFRLRLVGSERTAVRLLSRTLAVQARTFSAGFAAVPAACRAVRLFGASYLGWGQTRTGRCSIERGSLFFASLHADLATGLPLNTGCDSVVAVQGKNTILRDAVTPTEVFCDVR